MLDVINTLSIMTSINVYFNLSVSLNQFLLWLANLVPSVAEIWENGSQEKENKSENTKKVKMC